MFILGLLISPWRRSSLKLSDRGNILMLALWSIMILTMFAVSLSNGAISKITFVNGLGARNDLRYIAEAGVESGIIVLQEKGPTPPFDFMSETWRLMRSGRVGDGKYEIFSDHYDPVKGERGRV